MQLATAFVEIRARQDTLDRDLAQLRSKVEGSARGTASSFASIFGSIAVGAGIKKTIDAASQLEQAVGGSAAVFGDAASEIDRFASSSAESAGLSARAARELTSQIGGLLNGFGFAQDESAKLSINLVKLGGDLSATFGGKPEEAVQALGAAMRGETDPIERYGISLNQAAVNAKAVELGLADSTSKVDANAKAQATLAIITERSAGAQGQFAREADTAAGKTAIAAAKTEDAAASMGDSLLPVYAKVTDVVGKAADAFGALPDSVQTGIVAIAGIAAAAGPAARAIDAIKDAGSRIGGGLSRLSATAGSATQRLGGLSALSPVFLGTAAAAGIVGLAWFDAAQDAEELRAAAASLREEAEQTGKSLEEVATENMVRIFTEAGIARKALDELGLTFEDLKAPLTGSEQDFERWREATLKAGDTVGVTAGSASNLTSKVQQLRGQLDEAKESSDRTKDAQEALGLEQTETKVKTEGLTGAIKEQEEALGKLLDAILAQMNSDLAYRQSVDATEDAVAALTTAQREHGVNSEEYRDQLLSTEDRLLGTAAAAVRAAEDQAVANGQTLSAQERARIYKEELIRLKEQFPELAAVIQAYIDKLNAIPAEKTVTINQRLITEGRAKLTPEARGLALGGPFEAGELLRVGEAGREVVQFGQPGTVIPNHQLGRGGVNIEHVTVIAESPRDVFDEAQWYRRVAG